jgi:hypothetical protein
MSARQAWVPALAGADVVAEVLRTVTSATSPAPWSSVTVRRTTNEEPPEGATTVAVAVSAPLMPPTVPLTGVQA